jgi:hypothetical protein
MREVTAGSISLPPAPYGEIVIQGFEQRSASIYVKELSEALTHTTKTTSGHCFGK